MLSTKKQRDSKRSKAKLMAIIQPDSLLSKLIEFQSITPNSAGSIEFIADLLKYHGFSTYIQEFGPERVSNLYAVYNPSSASTAVMSSHVAVPSHIDCHNPEQSEESSEAFLHGINSSRFVASHNDGAIDGASAIIKYNICFAGHLDVVPPGDSWSSDPFKAIVKDGKIYGRGAVDMKGAIACMLASAINTLSILPQDRAISFLLTSDEEGDAIYGTQKMLEWMSKNGHSIDFAIVGEPTCKEIVGDTIKIGRRGSMHVLLKIFGKQGHVAYPALVDNPNTMIANILHDIAKLKFNDGDQIFDPSNLEIISIDTGNNISNSIPAASTAKLNVRFNINNNPDSILQQIKQIIEQHTTKYSLDIQVAALPFMSKLSSMHDIFKKSVEKITDIKPIYSTSGGTSDARFIQQYCPALEFGLLSDMAHKIDEYVKISDLQRLYDVYYHALCNLLTHEI